jgi:ribosomal protein S18 acetylase RimI-like enzyme
MSNKFPMVERWPPGYQVRCGRQHDRSILLKFLMQAYQENYPDQSFTHLKTTLDQYWSEETPVWFVVAENAQSVGCLWMGSGHEQITGNRYTHIFLIYIAPAHRRQGLGRRLLLQAEEWAQGRGDYALGLQVFVENSIAQALYQKMGYQPRSTFLLKLLQR